MQVSGFDKEEEFYAEFTLCHVFITLCSPGKKVFGKRCLNGSLPILLEIKVTNTLHVHCGFRVSM